MEKIKVLIVDDIPQIVKHFELIIESEADMMVVGTASTGHEAVELAEKRRPDVILMDVQMETDLAGIKATEKIKQLLPDIKIIILTIHMEDEVISSAYVAGAVDFLTKTASIVDIISAIRNIYNKKLPMRPEVAEKIVGELARLKSERSSMLYAVNIISKLTTSELEVLKHVYRGLTYKQIARQRYVEEVT